MKMMHLCHDPRSAVQLARGEESSVIAAVLEQTDAEQGWPAADHDAPGEFRVLRVLVLRRMDRIASLWHSLNEKPQCSFGVHAN